MKKPKPFLKPAVTAGVLSVRESLADYKARLKLFGGRVQKCKHKHSWLLMGGRIEWCYQCGSWRRLRQLNANSSAVDGAWTNPTGPDGENPFGADARRQETWRLRNRK